MIWAAIGRSTVRSELIVMRRDEDLPRGGYSAVSYVDTLEEGLVPMYNGEVFMQDNASIHTSHYARFAMAHWGITLLAGWPQYSPDLKPIEHL